MSARYNHDYAAFGEHVLCAPWMVADMESRAKRVKERAELTAPFDPDDKDGTHYKDSFEVEAGIRQEKTRRAYGRVSNTDLPTAIAVEYGWHDTPRYRTLGNALDAAKD